MLQKIKKNIILAYKVFSLITTTARSVLKFKTLLHSSAQEDMTMLNSQHSSTFKKTVKAVSNIDDLETLKGFRSFKLMKCYDNPPASSFEAYFVIHKSSMNFKDRVEIFACKSCSKIHLTIDKPCCCKPIIH